MTDIRNLVNSLHPEDLARLQEQGPDHPLDRAMLDAIDAAAGGPGEGRGYYVVQGSLQPLELREYVLRNDVAAAIFAPSSVDEADADA